MNYLDSIIDNRKQYSIDLFDNLNHNDIKRIVHLIKRFKNNNIYITGVGKSNNIAIQVSDLFKSVGIASFNLNLMNCLHGDIGVVKPTDLCIFITKSGKTKEIYDVIDHFKCKKIMVLCNRELCNDNNHKAKYDLEMYYISCNGEDGKFNMIPTTSVVNTLSYFNIVLDLYLCEINMPISEYKLNHPNGTIGLMNRKVNEFIDRDFISINLERNNETFEQYVISQSINSKCPMIIFENIKGHFHGILTTKDILVHISRTKYDKLYNQPLKDKIITNVTYLEPNNTIGDCLKGMNNENVKVIRIFPVVENSKCIGFVDFKEIFNNIK